MKKYATTTVRGYGKVEIVRLSKHVFEVVLTLKFGKSPPSRFAETLNEAVAVQGEFLETLMRLKEMGDSLE